MIPTYRPREDYLRKTIESVLQQDRGSKEMQIEVVDDCSPDVDVEAMLKSIAGERIAFSRTSKNLGLAGCWNACVERSRGQWVHILHQDDFVLPEFYRRLQQGARLHPEVSLIATRSFFVDEDGVILRVTERLRDLENGGRDVKAFLYGNPLQCAGVAVRRTFFEANGGYNPELVYTLDLEMWTRVISMAGGLVTPEPLSCYRLSKGSETSRLARFAEDVREFDRLNQLFLERHPGFDCNKAAREICLAALSHAERFWENGDAEAAEANLAYWRRNAPVSLRLHKFAGKMAKSLFR